MEIFAGYGRKESQKEEKSYFHKSEE